MKTWLALHKEKKKENWSRTTHVCTAQQLKYWIREYFAKHNVLVQMGCKGKHVYSAKAAVLVAPGHWVMAVMKGGNLELWDPYENAGIEGQYFRQLQKELAPFQEVMSIKYRPMDQQAQKDQRTCGYHVLQWVQDLDRLSPDEVIAKRKGERVGRVWWIQQVLEQLHFTTGRRGDITGGRRTARQRDHDRQGYWTRNNVSQEMQVKRWVQELRDKKIPDEVHRRWHPETRTTTLISHNIGGGLLTKLNSIREWVYRQEIQPMCIALQETWLTDRDIISSRAYKALARELPEYDLISSCKGEERSGGVAILVHTRLRQMVDKDQVIRGEGEAMGQAMLVPIKTGWGEQRWWIGSIYAPVRVQDRKSFYEKEMIKTMGVLAERMGDRDMLWIGMDANAVLKVDEDVVRLKQAEPREVVASEKQIQQESRTFQNWVEKMELVDAWRKHHEGEKVGSRESREKDTVAKRIDYVLTSSTTEQICEQVSMVDLEEMNWRSDHKLLITKVMAPEVLKKAMEGVQQRQIYDPKEIIRESELIQEVVRQITQEVQQEDLGIQQLSERVQAWMQENLKQTRKYKYISEKKVKGEKLEGIMTLLGMIKEALKKPGLYTTEQLKHRLGEVMKEQAESWEEKDKNSMIDILGTTLVVQWRWKLKIKKMLIELKEKEERRLRKQMVRGAHLKRQAGEFYMPWAKYTHHQGKKWRKPDTGIIALKNEQGQVRTGVEKDEVMVQYIQNMWGTKKIIKNTEYKFRRVVNEQNMNRAMNKSITGAEVQQGAMAMKEHKSPGTDLIPNEIWKGWTEEDYEWLAQQFNQIMQAKQAMPQQWKDILIKWIYKNKDPMLIKNYRPIALGNSLAKLYMKILTSRLEEVVEMEGLISDTQQGFRTDRSCAGAIMILQTLIGKYKERNMPFYMVGIDIEKAYDTVDHEVLWKILDAKGIKGKWLETVKEMYTGSRIMADTVQGGTEWIQVKRGIRQGCPMSPLLFGLYIDWVTETLEEVRGEAEPKNLLYADDMMVWANSKEAITNRLQKVSQALTDLGLAVNWGKTTVQANRMAQLANPGGEIQLQVQGSVKTLKSLKPTEAVRYLGIYVDAEMEANKGRELLTEKVKQKIENIAQLPANPMTKAMLIKSKIISAINYTQGVQAIGQQWCQEIDRTIYQAITGGYGGMSRCRREVLYRGVVKGGLGMMSVEDQYKVARLRVIAGLIEAGERQEQRGQKAWAKDLIIQELRKEQPVLQVYKEVKEMMEQLGLEMIYQGPSGEGWREQRWQSTEKPRKNSKNITAIDMMVHVGSKRIPWGQHTVSMRTLKWFEETKSMAVEEMVPAMEEYVNNRKQVCEQNGWTQAAGIKMGAKTVMWLQQKGEGRVVELTTDTEVGTGVPWLTRVEGKEGIKRNKMLIINNTSPKELWVEPWEEEEIAQVCQQMGKQGGVIVWVGFVEEELPDMLSEVGRWEATYLDWQSQGWESGRQQQWVPMGIQGESEWKVWVWTQGQAGEDTADWIHQVSHGGWPINNMYEEKTETKKQEWTCDMCHQKGQRINEYYGWCTNVQCGGVRTEGSRQDVSMGGKNMRRVDTVLLKSNNTEDIVGEGIRTFFTDASGQVINEESGIKQTGWGVVEVELRGKRMFVKRSWGKAVKGYPSVQKCEALAILEVIKTVSRGSKLHIHTDSKGTVQALRKMATKRYRQKRKLQNAQIGGQIIQMIEQKQLVVMVEWVKAHEEYEGHDRSWINEYKEGGNQLADQEAKKAVEEDMKERSIISTGWKAQDKKTGCICDWNGLPKMIQRQEDQRREERLRKPATKGATNGQGQYMEVVVARSSLAMKWIQQHKKNTAEHYQVLQYGMDRSITADRRKRWGQPVDGRCIPCQLLEGRIKQQTKEHIWSGECVATNDIMQAWVEAVEHKLKSWHIEHMTEEIIQAIIKRIGEIDLQQHSLANHAKGAVLVGVWDNVLLQNIKLIAHRQGQEEEAAMQLALALMGMHMETMMEVQRRWYQMVQVWEIPLTQEEKQAWQEMQKGGEVEDMTGRCQQLWKKQWYGGAGRRPIEETWARQAVREMIAREQGVREEIIKEREEKWIGEMRKKWLKRIKQMEEWMKDTEGLVKRLLWHGGHIKKKWKRMGEEWEEVRNLFLSEEEEKGRRYLTLIKKGLASMEREGPERKKQRIMGPNIPPIGETGSPQQPGSTPQRQEKLN